MEWILFIGFLFGHGLWTKHQNTKHIRALRKKYLEDRAAETASEYRKVKTEAESIFKPLGFKPGEFKTR